MAKIRDDSPSYPPELVGYLAPVEIAYITKFSKHTVLEWLRTGRLKGVKVSRQWRVHPDVLKSFIENGYQNEESK